MIIPSLDKNLNSTNLISLIQHLNTLPFPIYLSLSVLLVLVLIICPLLMKLSKMIQSLIMPQPTKVDDASSVSPQSTTFIETLLKCFSPSNPRQPVRKLRRSSAPTVAVNFINPVPGTSTSPMTPRSVMIENFSSCNSRNLTL